MLTVTCAEIEDIREYFEREYFERKNNKVAVCFAVNFPS